MATAEKYVGGGVPRKEDPKLLTGQGQFLEGLTLPGMLHAALVRSPYGSARIESVDVSAAAAADGVVAAYSGRGRLRGAGRGRGCGGGAGRRRAPRARVVR